MSPRISEEVILLLMSCYGGLVLVLCYDIMRIFRRVFHASVFRVITEDIIFWTVAAIFMFDIFLKYNYGRPRYFAVGAALGTMLLFELLIGKRVVDKSAILLRKMLNTLLKPLKKIYKNIKIKIHKRKKSKRKKVILCRSKKEKDILPQDD